MKLEAALSRYITQLRADGRSPHTVGQVTRHVRLLGRWLANESDSLEVAGLTHEHLAGFLASDAATLTGEGRPKKPASLNALRSSLKTFGAYIHAAGYCSRNPAALVRRAICGDPIPRALTERQVQRLFAAMEADETPAARRDRALFGLMLATGIRLSSALAINVEDIDLDEGVLEVRFVKLGREQTVDLDVQARVLLKSHVGQRLMGPLFQNQHGERLSQRTAQRRFRAASIRAKVVCSTVHSLRHTFAGNHLQSNKDVRLTQRALGHRSLQSTALYISGFECRESSAGSEVFGTPKSPSFAFGNTHT